MVGRHAIGDPLERAQQRLTLHELIRLGVGRQEDLRLLQNVAMQAQCLPRASLAQLLREAALREEWRSGREAALLASLRPSSLATLLGVAPGQAPSGPATGSGPALGSRSRTDSEAGEGRGAGLGGALSAADGRLLSEQVAALTEMMEQQQQRRRCRAAAEAGGRATAPQRAGAAAGSGASPTPSTSTSTASTPGAGAGPGVAVADRAGPGRRRSSSSASSNAAGAGPELGRRGGSAAGAHTQVQPPGRHGVRGGGSGGGGTSHAGWRLGSPQALAAGAQAWAGAGAGREALTRGRPPLAAPAPGRRLSGAQPDTERPASVSAASPSFPSDPSDLSVQQQRQLQEQDRQERQGVGTRSPTGTASAAAAAAAVYGAVVGSPARALRSSGGGAGRRGGLGGSSSWSSPRERPPGTAGASSSPSSGGGRVCASPPPARPRPRPGSAPEEAMGGGGQAGPQGFQAEDVTGVAAAAAAAAAAVSPVSGRRSGGGGGGVGAAAAAGGGGGAGAAGASSGGGGGGGSGFRNLLRLQQLLMQGLHEHAAAEGEGGALAALAASVGEGQAFFAECLAEALEAAGLPPDAAAATTAAPPTRAALAADQRHTQEAAAGSPSLSPPRRRLPLALAAWDRMLRLGQLGLTRGDVARLEGIRQQQAARVIQRQVRKWLRRRWHQRRLAEARARADAMQRRLRERAAVVIQAWFRGHLARRLAARMAQAAAAQAAAARREEAAREAAAACIQAAWRRHRRAARYAAALARAQALLQQQQREQDQQQNREEEHGWRHQLDGKEEEEEGRSAERGRAGPHGARRDSRQRDEDAVAGAARGGSCGGDGGGGRSRFSRDQAIVIIQAHLRGWLVRRSPDMWWARASRRLRQRRAAVRGWRQHNAFMRESYGLQAQLLGALVRAARVAEALRADAARQEAEMAAAFQQWLVGQQRVALSQPLPRGWVPHPHPEQPGRMCFLNTRTGELHALHPAVAELARFARTQHDAAAAGLRARFAGVPAFLDRLHAAAAEQAAISLRAIGVVHARVAAGAGPGAAQPATIGEGEVRAM